MKNKGRFHRLDRRGYSNKRSRRLGPCKIIVKSHPQLLELENYEARIFASNQGRLYIFEHRTLGALFPLANGIFIEFVIEWLEVVSR
jgi:hypothetical protein